MSIVDDTKVAYPDWETNVLANALKAICTAGDSGPWIAVYRSAGGGYEGLQAIAEAALKIVGRS